MNGQLTLPLSQEYLETEIRNIVNAFNKIGDRIIKRGDSSLSNELIAEYNRLVLKNLKLAPEVTPGQVRQYNVGVARYLAAPWQDCEYLLARLCDWLNGPDFMAPNEDHSIIYSIIKAVVAHLYLAWIHPFGDGNGRTARLVELQILLSAGFPTPAAHLLSNHYNQTRTEYYRQLSITSQSGGDVLPFIEYAVQGLVDGLRSLIETIKTYQMDIIWENHVHSRFRHRTGPSADRRKWLVLDLSKLPNPVPRSSLREISARLAGAYAGKTDKTLTRDLNFLERMDLIVRTSNGIRAKKELVRAFLPDRADRGPDA